MTNNNSQKEPKTRTEPTQTQIELDELWLHAASERRNIFMGIKNRSGIPSGFELVGHIAEPIEKKSKEPDRASSHWEIWKDKNKSILIFRVASDEYELLALKDLGLTFMFEYTEFLKATMKLFRMFN